MSPTGSNGLGISFVRGRNLVPFPPAIIIASRGKYDFIAEFELPNFEAAAALKMITMSSGGFSEMEIMEPVDLNQIAKSAFSAAGEYKAVGK